MHFRSKRFIPVFSKPFFVNKNFPFANKNEVFITKQGFGEPLKTSKACFLRNIIFYLKK